MEQSHEQKKRPSPQEEGEGRITYLEIRIASARKSPLAHSSNAHYGRISHHGRSGQRNRMQSYGKRRMKPESKCSRRTTHIQTGQEPTVRTLILVMTNGPCLTSANRVHFEEPEEFRLLPETCPVVFAYMPSIQRRKAHHKTLRNVSFHTFILGRFTGWSSICYGPAISHDVTLRFSHV